MDRQSDEIREPFPQVGSPSDIIFTLAPETQEIVEDELRHILVRWWRGVAPRQGNAFVQAGNAIDRAASAHPLAEETGPAPMRPAPLASRSRRRLQARRHAWPTDDCVRRERKHRFTRQRRPIECPSDRALPVPPDRHRRRRSRPEIVPANAPDRRVHLWQARRDDSRAGSADGLRPPPP